MPMRMVATGCLCVTLTLVQGALPGFVADLTTTIFFRDGRSLTTEARVYRADHLLRQEPKDSGDDVIIFDFAARKINRLVPSQKISLESPLPAQVLVKAKREGLIPSEPNPHISEEKIILGTVEFDGHPCDLTLLIKGVKAEKKIKGRPPLKEYTLIWMARDLHIPLRVSYTQADLSTVLIEYRHLRRETLDPSIFRIPEGFLNTTPF